MQKGWFRRWRPLWAATAIFLIGTGLMVLVWAHRTNTALTSYLQILSSLILILPGLYSWALRKMTELESSSVADSERLDRVTDQLARDARAQWTRAAEERGLASPVPMQVTWSKPRGMAGSAGDAAASSKFEPLPGLPQTDEAGLVSGRATDLYSLYGGLGSGRLIIVGPPGSGKTASAILLVLAALRHRERFSAEKRRRVPVPVLVTAHGWDPENGEGIYEWLARKLQGTYPLFATAKGARTAATLLEHDRITVILDGLDEISPDLQPMLLRALSRQATFRLVLLSRSNEMAVAAARDGVLQGAVAIELDPVDPAEAASYLERTQIDPPPDEWREMTSRIRANPTGPLSTALNNPLTVTLVRDTYRDSDSIRELINFSDTLSDRQPDTPPYRIDRQPAALPNRK